MKVGIYFNKKYIECPQPILKRIESEFAQRKVGCREICRAEELEGLDILLVLGGDGTILNFAAECACRSIKILGINFGHMGFLAEFDESQLDEAVKLVLSGKYSTKKRTMLEIGYGEKNFYALNDLVIQRNTGGSHFCNTVNIHAEIDGTTVDNFSSDGIIVSTPTGSTAYSLSAGGSVLAPDVNAFILTPICPHSLHSRPVVYGDNSVLSLTAFDTREQLVMIADGRIIAAFGNGERVTVKKSRHAAEFIVKDKDNFFNKLLLKLNIWSK